MGTNGSTARHRLWSKCLARAAVATALALGGAPASADEVGESFWTPGSLASLAATPSQPGFSLTSTYYHTSTSAGSDVARARLIRVGRLTGEVGENVSAISIQPEDLVTVTPSYTCGVRFSAARQPSRYRRPTAANGPPTMPSSAASRSADRSSSRS